MLDKFLTGEKVKVNSAHFENPDDVCTGCMSYLATSPFSIPKDSPEGNLADFHTINPVLTCLILNPLAIVNHVVNYNKNSM